MQGHGLSKSMNKITTVKYFLKWRFGIFGIYMLTYYNYENTTKYFWYSVFTDRRVRGGLN